MVDINVYNDIANQKDSISMSSNGVEGAVFSAETVKNIFTKYKQEKEFRFNIHCDGGEVSEGFTIYDIIRNSGKIIYTNIEGGCHSMAIVLLLAAPFENRTANRNARALIHQVYGAGGPMNAMQLRELAEDVEDEQNAILDIYADRTGYDREELEILMKEEKQRTANDLLEYRFISKINNYTTNKKLNDMSKRTPKRSLLNRASDFISRVTNHLSGTFNYDFTDEDGNVIFSTASEDDTLEVGMEVTAESGTFELQDGRIVIVENYEIIEIQEPSGDTEEVENLRNQLEEARNLVEEMSVELKNLKGQVQSNYNANPRSKNVRSRNTKVGKSKDDLKYEVKGKINNWKKGGK